MRKLMVISLILMIGLVMAMPVMARDLGEVISTPWDTLRGENESCPVYLQPYIAKTFDEAIGKADLRLELSYKFTAKDLTDNNSVILKAGLEY